MTLFTLHRATVNYENQIALADISLSISQGEQVAIVGHSGAGKSTLLNTLFEQHKADIALCPQADGLVGILSVYHNIYMGQLERESWLYNVWNLIRPFSRHKAAVKKIAHDLGIADKLNHSVDQLSGGQQQRVAIGRALYRQRPIFFGDEPVSGLDPVQSHAVLSQLLAAHQTAVVTLHDTHLATDLFDRIIGLKQGKLVFDLPTEQVNSTVLDNLYDK